VGKSTLLNALVGEHVAIVSPKPQTTRTRITGILTRGEVQFVFIDTPGVLKPRNKLGEFMSGEIKGGLKGADTTVLVSEPIGEIRIGERELLENLASRKTPVILVLNKIDTLPRKEDMMGKISSFSAIHRFEEIVPVSAKTGDGVELLLTQIARFAAPAPHYFDEDSYTEQPERVLVAELIREKILLLLRDEIPHGIAVVVEKMSGRDMTDITDVSAIIYCEKDSHKGIIIGRDGETLKRVASGARASIERFLQCKINLQIWVKVSRGWRNRDCILRQFGFR